MEPEELGAQLRCPSGAEALDVARQMNEANRAVNHACIDLLRMAAEDRVLELGPGNGAFASDIVSAADDVRYTGLDWSAAMVAEAEKINAELVAAGRASFHQGSSDGMPFPAASFDKLLSVHNLYFWEYPMDHLAEVRRVIKPGGLFCIAFGDRSFMKDLPFVPFGFALYDSEEVQALLREAGLRVLDSQQHHETGRSNTGEIVEKVINIILCGG